LKFEHAMVAFLAFWVGMSGIGMNCTPAPEPVTPDVVDDCARACIRLSELGCYAGATTPNGATCEEVCHETEATGWSTMHPACIALAKDCKEADRLSAEGCD